MSKRRRTWLIVLVALYGIALAVYFEPSHCVRGWLWGEAFFDGRPTSYWRLRCDEWLERFESPDAAVRNLYPNMIAGGLFVRMQEPRPRRQNMTARWFDWLRSTEQRERDSGPPAVLLGDDPGSEPVLQELAAEEKYWDLVVSALLRLKRDQRHREGGTAT